MNMILGLVRAFVWIGSLYIGIKSIKALYYYIRYHDVDVFEYRHPLWLVASITLLILIPGEFLCTVITHTPEGNFTIDVNYTIDGTYYKYDEISNWEREIPLYKTGTAPLEISISNEEDTIDDGETYYGGTISHNIYYTNIYAYGITLDYFNNHFFVLDSEIQSNSIFTEEDMEYEDCFFNLEIEIGEVSDKTLGYSFEDKFHDISIEKILETIVFWIFALCGIIIFFISDREFLKEIKGKMI